MKAKRLITGALVCLSLIGTAGASTRITRLGSLPDGTPGDAGNAFAVSQPLQQPTLAAANPSSVTFADLTPASYTAAVFGTARNAGAYGAPFRVSVAAVPEIETWLMLLIGFALAAYQLHRKQKSLGQQVLNDEALSSA